MIENLEQYEFFEKWVAEKVPSDADVGTAVFMFARAMPGRMEGLVAELVQLAREWSNVQETVESAAMNLTNEEIDKILDGLAKEESDG